MKGFFFLPFVSFSSVGVLLLIWIDTIIACFFEKHKWFCKNNLDWYKYFSTKNGGDFSPPPCLLDGVYHRLCSDSVHVFCKLFGIIPGLVDTVNVTHQNVTEFILLDASHHLIKHFPLFKNRADLLKELVIGPRPSMSTSGSAICWKPKRSPSSL